MPFRNRPVPINPSNPGCIPLRDADILAALILICEAQITGAIVKSVSVNVIDYAVRPIPGEEKPSQPMGVMQPALPDYEVTVRIHGPERLVPIYSVAPDPCKYTGFLVVQQAARNLLEGKFIVHACALCFISTCRQSEHSADVAKLIRQ